MKWHLRASMFALALLTNWCLCAGQQLESAAYTADTAASDPIFIDLPSEIEPRSQEPAVLSPPTTESQKANPLPPVRLEFADWFSPGYYGQTTPGNQVVFRAYVPWRVLNTTQLARLTVPYQTSAGGDSTDSSLTETPTGPNGLGDTELYDVTILPTHIGDFKIGPVFLIPTGSQSGVGGGKWDAGPALGFDTQFSNLTIGVFSLNYFSFAGVESKPNVSKSKFQPIFQYELPHGWSIGASQMNFTYDWISQKWTNVPVGIEIGKRFQLFRQDMKFTTQAEYNLASTSGTSAWTFRFTFEYFIARGN